MLVCSQLTDLVSTAAEFCKAAGESGQECVTLFGSQTLQQC
jgi:hypothetical protein